ncbi:hypothetical protein SK128_024126 [Halocaridina rubra]|uniref:Uncharacterized protein n=1 Tax=Halocaridina rubra TaxID=373956 RepID=A0AAN8XQC7_HALRR
MGHYTSLTTTWLLIVAGIIMSLRGLDHLWTTEESEDGERNLEDMKFNSRQRRLLFYSSDKGLSFPPRTLVLLEGFLILPGIRNLPLGYTNNMTLSAEIEINLDKLEMTSGENPWFFFPYYDVTGSGTGNMQHETQRAGGDRYFMYEFVEAILESIGISGKACLLRSICEIFEVPLKDQGFLGEVLELFLSASLASCGQDRLADYVEAEKWGKREGNCSHYFSSCQHSIFATTTINPSKLIPVSEGVSREKRFIYFTRERRLTFPPSTKLELVPKIRIPSRERSQTGYSIPHFQMWIKFEVDMDKLGLSTEEHPFGIIDGLDELFRGKRDSHKAL